MTHSHATLRAHHKTHSQLRASVMDKQARDAEEIALTLIEEYGFEAARHWALRALEAKTDYHSTWLAILSHLNPRAFVPPRAVTSPPGANHGSAPNPEGDLFAGAAQ